jgi:hypothetical protein
MIAKKWHESCAKRYLAGVSVWMQGNGAQYCVEWVLILVLCRIFPAPDAIWASILVQLPVFEHCSFCAGERSSLGDSRRLRWPAFFL